MLGLSAAYVRYGGLLWMQGIVLRNRSSGNRDHHPVSVQTDKTYARQRQAAVGDIRDFGNLNSVDLPRDHLALSARRSSEPIRQGFSQPSTSQKYSVNALCARNASDIRRKQHTGIDLRLLCEGRTLCVRKRTRCCALPLRWSGARAPLTDRQTVCRRGRRGNDHAWAGGHHRRFYRVSGCRCCRSNSGSSRNILARLPVVVLLAPSYKRWAKNPQLNAFVRGVTAAATGAIAGAVVVLARRSVYDLPTMLICAVSLAVLFRWKIPEPVLISADSALSEGAAAVVQPSTETNIANAPT